MSDPGTSRRKQLLDKYLAGEIDKETYDRLAAELSGVEPASAGEFDSGASSVGSFAVTESRTASERSAYATPVPLLEAGLELGGFELKRRLKRGGMGEVWQAYDPTGERMVVIKVLPPELQRSPDEMARVKQTFNRVHNLQHEHICPVYLLGRDPRFGYFIVMKFLQGDTLVAYRNGFVKQHGSFSAEEAIRALLPVASALDYAHSRQIIHRDVKPQNIMMNADGSDVQLVDFGLAAEVRTSVMRISQVQMETCGTYPYMAPEQWRGEMQDARTDQYALAVVAFELLTGSPPFEAADPTVLRMCVLNDAIPSAGLVAGPVHTVISRGMAKQRADRFENCTSFVKALKAALTPVDDALAVVELDEDSVTGRRPAPLAPSTRVLPPAVSERPRRPDSTNPKTFGKPNRESDSGSSKSSSKRRPADVNDEDMDDLEFLEPTQKPTSKSDSRPRPLDSKRQAPSVRPADSEASIEHVNSKALFWVCFVGSLICVPFLGLFGWVLWNGFPSFGSPGTPNETVTQSESSAGKQANNGSPPAEKAPALRYRWEQGKQYVYSVSLELEPDPQTDIVVAMTGNATYNLGQPVASKRKGPDGKGTGTGFVVHPNGTLITCQHVVDGASEIEVAIGGVKYMANVILEDVEHDLAVIRIDANGLPTLPLADSEKVQVGEEVRAIGFPFASILGDNIKATRGTISGVNNDDGRKVFQVDAGINPGNSGGPLVNERGEVIGVNFAKLSEEVATNVGFAVPINDGIELLRAEGVTYTAGSGKTPKLEGPDLVKRVSAATALITVNSGGAAAAGLNHFELRCNSALSSTARSKAGNFVDPSKSALLQQRYMSSIMNRGGAQPDTVETDALGRIHEFTGDRAPLPAYLGPLSILVLEQLPSVRRPNWSNSYLVTIVVSEDRGETVAPPSRFRPRIRPPNFPGFPGFPGVPFPGVPGMPEEPPKTTRLPGRVQINYSLQESVGDLVKIKKDFDLETKDQVADKPRIKLTGTGVFTFDARVGLPRRMDYSATLQENEQNKSTTLPIRLSYQLADGQEPNPQGPVVIKPAGPPNMVVPPVPPPAVPAAKAPPAVPPVAAAPVAVPDVPPEGPLKLTADEIDQCITDLQGSNAGRVSQAASKLQRATPLEDRREKVDKVLAELLKDKNQFRRKQAIDALGTWARPETIPLLIQCLDEPSLLVKLAAIDTLGKLRDERAAEPLARLVTEPGPRVQAVKALRSLGAKSEQAVLALLTNQEPGVRQEACRLLKDIGTAASLPALKTASEDADRAVASLAKDAAKAIAMRN